MTARRIARRVLLGLGLVAALSVFYVFVLVMMTPNVAYLRQAHPTQTSYMLMRADERETDAIDRVEWTELDKISPLLACAVIKAEDGGFFRHAGFEWGEIRKAFWSNVRGRSRRGASTITQQLARNLYLSPDRSLHRKLREAFITRQLEHTLDKHRILELYLNVVEWGDGVWGAKQAARVYLGHSASEVSVFEAAFLASLLPAPRAPLAGHNRHRALAAQQRVLFKLMMSGLISIDEYTDGIARARFLASELASGRSVTEALAVVGTANLGRPISSARPIAKPIPPEEALATACGLDQELANLR